MDQIKNKYIKIKQALQKRSDFFCPAKWTELYLYLNHGNSNSCHHPIPHAIPKELLTDPFVLHNTPHKLQQQQLMIDGQRPQECHMCWHIEDADDQAISDRLVKSATWQDQIDTLTVNQHSIPKFIEVVFDNTCNLTCSYCDSGQSSSWAAKIHRQKIELQTDYRNLYNKVHVPPGQTNQIYYDAWMRWWPMIRHEVSVLKVSGGEPLISNYFWDFFEVLGTAPQLNFQINSNLSVSQQRLQKLIDMAPHFKSVQIGVSIDGVGAIAEYARRGLDYDLLISNIEHWCQHGAENCSMYLQSTVNIFSIWGFADFLMLFAKFKRKYPTRFRTLYATVVRFPEFQSVNLLPSNLKDQLYDKIHQTWQEYHTDFDEKSTIYINKILSYLKNNPKSMIDHDPDRLKNDLVTFIQYYDSFDQHKLANVFPKPFVDWVQSLSKVES